MGLPEYACVCLVWETDVFVVACLANTPVFPQRPAVTKCFSWGFVCVFERLYLQD